MDLSARASVAYAGGPVLASAAAFVAVWLFAPSHPLQDLANFLPLHSFIEVASIVIASLVYAVVWNSYSRERPGNVVLLGCALLAVALIDFAHALSYPGMPLFVTPAGAEKSIFFWLAARGFLGAALFATAWLPSRPLALPSTRYALLLVAVALALLVYWLGLFHLDSLPHTYVEGIGLTQEKIGAESAIIALLAVAAWPFFRRARRGSRIDALLFTATALSLISELCFTHYATVTDAYTLFGHVLKVAGYAYIFAAVFVSSVREPFEGVLDRERKLVQAERIAQVGSWEVDLRADRLNYSGEALRIHGLTPASFDGTLSGAIGLAHADDRQRLTTAINDTLYAGKPFSIDYRVVRPDGSVRFVHAEDEVERDASGHPLRAFGITQDITERKHAEEALRRFRLAMDLSVDSIYLTDPVAMRFVDVNSAACRRTGFTREQLLRMGPQDLLDKDLAQIEQEYQQVIAAGDAGIMTQNTFITSGGGRRWTELYRRAFEMEGGRLIVTIGRDVTERKEADAKIARLNRLYAVLSGINSTIVRIRDGAELYQEACRILVESGQLALAYICVIDPVDQRLRLVASAGIDAAEFLDSVQSRMSLRDGEAAGYGPPALAIREARPVVVNDVAGDTRIRDGRAHAARGIRSVAALPICVEGKQVAVVGLHAAEAGFFDEQQMRLLVELAGDIGFALDHIEKSKRLDYLAFYDQLTGLANRPLFLERLAQTLISAGQAGEKAALLLVDLERLATVNESLGRQAGDALVAQFAERLTRTAGSSEVARVSANHFAVLFRSVKGRSEVVRRSDRLWQVCFGASFRVAGSELRSSARGGVALFPSSADAEALLQNAEAALRRAKQTGERLVFHAPEMTVKTTERLSLENRLRLALDRREFVLHYQPKVDLDTGGIAGVEALMRWQSPELGMVPPLKFIPVMEETGMILDAGAWALTRAIEDHMRWRAMGLSAPRVAVNVSAVQLRQKGYVGALTEALGAGAQPASIDLEITESVVMEDIQGNIDKLKEARKLGVSIAIDDFGTGYSSLGYLARLPVQALKIDRSFIIAMLDDPATMTLVQTIISLAHSLKLKVIAEGVESEEQARTLRLLRCDEMQGYLFSRPLPFEEISRLLAARP